MDVYYLYDDGGVDMGGVFVRGIEWDLVGSLVILDSVLNYLDGCLWLSCEYSSRDGFTTYEVLILQCLRSEHFPNKERVSVGLL